MPRVVGLLNPYELQFLRLIERFKRVWAYEVELRKATRERPFRMRNPDIWEIMLADRDIFVIDFASWLESFSGKGGVLDRVTDADLTEFAIEERPREGDDPYWERLHWEARVKSFERLFPVRSKEKKRWPEKADRRHLKSELVKLAVSLEAQRNARAHMFDGRDFETVANLHFTEIARIFHRVLEVLHDVRLLVDRSNHHFPEVAEPKDDETARDLVDVLLLGSLNMALIEWMSVPGAEGRTYPWQHRAAYYDYIHELHDAAGAPESPLFNDRFIHA